MVILSYERPEPPRPLPPRPPSGPQWDEEVVIVLDEETTDLGRRYRLQHEAARLLTELAR